MNLSEWRARRVSEGELYVLPSGLTVRLKKCDIIDLAVHGDIPKPLLSVATKIANGGITDPDDPKKPLIAQADIVDLAKVSEYRKVLEIVAKATITEPPIVDENPQEHELGIGELTFNDLFRVYVWAHQGGEELKPFRDEHSGHAIT